MTPGTCFHRTQKDLETITQKKLPKKPTKQTNTNTNREIKKRFNIVLHIRNITPDIIYFVATFIYIAEFALST